MKSLNLLPSIFDNPILVRELRRRMRGRALVYSMIGYIILITLVAILIVLGMAPRDFDAKEVITAGGGENFLTRLINCGMTIFKWITGIQTMLVLIVAPTITAGMTTGEKERKTFEFLQVTTIRPWAYILGSFLSTIFYVLLALICALPPLCLAFLYGGVAPSDVVQTFMALFAGSLVLSAFGLYISSVRDRTRAAQGIVVFMIFLLLFVGTTFLRGLMMYFGGSAAGAGAAQGFFAFGIAIPPGVLIAAATLVLTAVFLLLATRKLYRSDERAFTYWQFALLLLLGVLIMTGLSWEKAIGDRDALIYAVVSCVLLATGAFCFGVGQMEVGDELWRLKRRIPILQKFDESLIYLAAVGAFWAWGTFFWKSAAVTCSIPDSYITGLVVIGLASLFFFVAAGRCMTILSPTRAMAGRLTFIFLFAFWFFLPLMGLLLAALSNSMEPLRSLLGQFSPIFLVLEAINSTAAHPKGAAAAMNGSWDWTGPGGLQLFVYVGLGALIAIYGETRRLRAARTFNCHFDMPGA